MVAPGTTGFFLESEDTLDDPFAALAALRERSPVFRYEPLEQWFVLRYDDVRAALADERLSADRLEGYAERAPAAAVAELRQRAPWLLGPGSDHAWLRPVLQRGYTAATARIEASMEAVADEVLDEVLVEAVAGEAPAGAFDVAGGYAFPLTARALCDVLGVPRQDAGLLVRWSLDIVGFFGGVPITAQPTGRVADSAAEMMRYTQSWLTDRRAELGDGLLATVAGEAVRGAQAIDEEVAGAVVLPLLGGHVAVRQLIGNAVWLLLGRPGAWARVAAAPELLAGAVEESLRYEPPVPLVPRTALERLELGGETIEPGDVLQLSIAAANRDPARFPDPDRFDLERRPAGALSLGYGPYSCAGARLVRLQARAALAALARRAPRLELDPDRETVWCRTPTARGPDVLGVRTAPRATPRRTP